MSEGGRRELVGYGSHPPDPRWPGDARVAVQFVLNYEEGAERSVEDGDTTSETFLSDVWAPEAFADRHMSMESLYAYGARAGAWRVLRAFGERGLPLTVFAVAVAMERNPAVANAFVAAGHEVAGHGYRWLPYQAIDEQTEREHLRQAVASISEITGSTPVGWYTGRDNPRTRRLVVEHGGFLYDSDSYADDLPYWTEVGGIRHLVVPYTLDVNDMRFLSGNRLDTADDFFAYCRDAFDALYEEGAYAPKMLSVGLHGRIIGRPGRILGLERFLDHVASHDATWICRRDEIAHHWYAQHADGPVFGV